MPEFYGVQKGAGASDSTMIRVIRICRKCGTNIFSDVPEGFANVPEGFAKVPEG